MPSGVPNISFEKDSSSLGAVNPTDDGVVGIIFGVDAVPAGGLIPFLTTKAINSLADAEALGIDAAYDAANESNAYAELSRFYAKVTGGGLAYIMLVVNTTSYADVMLKTNDIAKKLLADSQSAIDLLFVNIHRAAAYVPVVTAGIDDDIIAAMTNAQALSIEMRKLYFHNYHTILPGESYTGVSTALPDLRGLYENDQVSISLEGDATGYQGVLGTLAAQLAVFAVNFNCGRVASGELGISAAYLTDNSTSEELLLVQDAINDKGYIFPIVRKGKAGYFYNDDPSAVGLDNDFNSISRNRVTNKVLDTAYSIYVDYINSDITLDGNGDIAPGAVKSLESVMENAIEQLMISTGELSGIKVTIPLDQSLTDFELDIYIDIQPNGQIKYIRIPYKLVNSL